MVTIIGMYIFYQWVHCFLWESLHKVNPKFISCLSNNQLEKGDLARYLIQNTQKRKISHYSGELQLFLNTKFRQKFPLNFLNDIDYLTDFSVGLDITDMHG